MVATLHMSKSFFLMTWKCGLFPPFLYYFSHLAFHSSIDLCHALSLSYWLQHWSDYIWCRVWAKMRSQGQQLLMQAENRSSVCSALFPEVFYLLGTVLVQDSSDPHLARWLFAFQEQCGDFALFTDCCVIFFFSPSPVEAETLPNINCNIILIYNEVKKWQAPFEVMELDRSKV